MKSVFRYALPFVGFSLVAATASPRDPHFPQWNGKDSVKDYANRAKLQPTLTLDLGGGVKWEGVLIPAGSFVMGSPEGEAKTQEEATQEKQHKVTISRPFYMGKYEVTQAQYQQVMGDNPSRDKGDTLPVHNLEVKDALAFCQKLSQKTGRKVQLPTESEWEYACRAGTTTLYHSGDTIEDLDKVAWFGANSGRALHPVGQKLPNAWGLFDMHGNIREFVRDLWDEAPRGDAVDPTGPKEGDPKNHVVKGGAYTAAAEKAGNVRSGSRRPTESLPATGFRIAVAVPESQ
jgi:formylglycine-generating enzyme required for sulfatase activity